MRVLVVGSGGREHALAWKLSQEAEVFAAPGNPGIAEVAECFPTPISDHQGLADLARRLAVDLVVVGPEDPLIAGLADVLRGHGFVVFGPDKAAALMEGSKAFSKELMAKAGVPTARFQVFTDTSPAKEFARQLHGMVAVKASGAALGKGVVICNTPAEADDAIEMMLSGGLGEAGKTIVVEELMHGPEYSLLTICSEGGHFSLPVAQDFKRAYDFDQGPNTGGMGSVSPVSWVHRGLIEQTEEQVVAPVLRELQSRGTPFRGLLFSGLMMTDTGPRCLEYNVRFGDPECQSVLMRLGGGFLECLHRAASGEAPSEIEVLNNAVVTVAVASAGYPGPYEKGVPIRIGDMPDGVQVFHAGTAVQDGRLVTAGGRVLGVTAVADTAREAQRLAYEGVERIEFRGKQYRRDIAALEAVGAF